MRFLVSEVPLQAPRGLCMMLRSTGRPESMKGDLLGDLASREVRAQPHGPHPHVLAVCCGYDS